MITYRIRDWEAHFETTESRKVKGTRWVPVPNKHDGKGYRRIAEHKNAISIFCGWNLILQVASKMPTRGTLADEDGPLDAEDLAAMTGFPSRIFEQAFAFLSEPRIGWIVQDDGKPANVPTLPDHPADATGTPADTFAEGKGREGQDKEEKEKKEQRAKPRADTRGVRLPDDFCLNSEMREWAAANTPSVNVEAVLAEFRDYWLALPGQKGKKLDWLATWRNRMREVEARAVAKNGNRNAANQSTPQRSGKASFDIKFNHLT